MVIRWDQWALNALTHGIEPYEVIQALGAERRLPRRRNDVPAAELVLTVYARTASGRPLAVTVRQLNQWDWVVMGAVEPAGAALAEFEQWEAKTDG